MQVAAVHFIAFLPTLTGAQPQDESHEQRPVALTLRDRDEAASNLLSLKQTVQDIEMGSASSA